MVEEGGIEKIYEYIEGRRSGGKGCKEKRQK